MTISTKTFQNLQPGVSAADDLRVRTPINQALQWLGEGLPNEINSALAQISQSVSVQIAAYAAARPTFSAHKNATDQTDIATTDTKVTFGTEDWDVGSYFATSTWTPPAGKYRISATLRFSATNGVDGEALMVTIYKNGAALKRDVVRRSGTQSHSVRIAAIVEADGNDTFEIYASKSGAGDGTVEGAASVTFFQGEAIA
jgi:hypothetical protein